MGLLFGWEYDVWYFPKSESWERHRLCTDTMWGSGRSGTHAAHTEGGETTLELMGTPSNERILDEE